MNEYDIKRLGLILAIQAEIEGMKAENAKCAMYDGVDPKYTQQNFSDKSLELKNLVYAHNDQI